MSPDLKWRTHLLKDCYNFFFYISLFCLFSLKASFVALRNAFLLIFEYVSVQSGGFCFLEFKKVFSYVDFPGSRRARTFVSPSAILLPATIDRSTGLETQQTYIFLESTHQELFKNIYFDGSTSSLKWSKTGYKLTELAWFGSGMFGSCKIRKFTQLALSIWSLQRARRPIKVYIFEKLLMSTF